MTSCAVLGSCSPGRPWGPWGLSPTQAWWLQLCHALRGGWGPRGTPLSLAVVWKFRDLLSPTIPTAHSCQECSSFPGRRNESGPSSRALLCPGSGLGCLGVTSKPSMGILTSFPEFLLGLACASVYPSLGKGPALVSVL